MISESLWNYYRDEINNVANDSLEGTSFEYKTKITGKQLALLP